MDSPHITSERKPRIMKMTSENSRNPEFTLSHQILSKFNETHWFAVDNHIKQLCGVPRLVKITEMLFKVMHLQWASMRQQSVSKSSQVFISIAFYMIQMVSKQLHTATNRRINVANFIKSVANSALKR